MRAGPCCGALALAAFTLAMSGTSAAADTWRIESLYSNADGDVQFVVLHESAGSDGQGDLESKTLTAIATGFSRTYVFDHDLPAAGTAGRRVLVATPGFAALGIVAPDYVMPARFLPTAGATLDFAGRDAIAYEPLPSDGTNARLRDGSSARNIATNFTGASGSAPAGPITAIEYYDAQRAHYFVSALAPDIDALDEGLITGWQRTGQTFRVYPSASAAPSGASPVCRYYIPPAHGDSHFLSASAAECANVAARAGSDPNYSGYILETPSAFFVLQPDANGACGAGTVPVYRLWNARADSNHRYTTSSDVRADMLARGYVAEGAGDGVTMCVPATPDDGLRRVSAPSTLVPGCEGLPAGTPVFTNAEVEPHLAIDPLDPDHFVAVWQQDRISTGAARANLAGASFDGGRTWTRSMATFSRCSGGSAVGFGFQRSSDPWVSFAPDGTVHQIAIATSGVNFQNGSDNAVLASRSFDGGRTWSVPTIVQRDGPSNFNDKETITADPHDARYVYAAWDRLERNGGGPSWFTRSADGGASWAGARSIYDPGPDAQTLNNEIVVLPDGTLVDFFSEFTQQGKTLVVRLALVRSTDRGDTWSAPIYIADSLSVGTFDTASGFPVRDATHLGSIAVGPHGELAVAWQDARFTALRDAIAFSRSLDGGLTWSAPVAINAVLGVAAFVPTVQIRADGTYGVTYYDWRNDTASPNTLPIDYRLTQSSDGITWREVHVAGPFDLLKAPVSRGIFLGDYQSLATRGNAFVALFSATTYEPDNPTDIFVWTGNADAGKRAVPRDVGVTVAREAFASVPSADLVARATAAAQQVLARRRSNADVPTP